LVDVMAWMPSVVRNARHLRAGETLGGVLGLIHEEDRKLADGEDSGEPGGGAD
jgi:hypothetical protein